MSELICGLTNEDIEKLKKKHGVLSVVTIKDGEEIHSAIFKEPTMDIMSAANLVGKTDEMKSAMVLYDNCMIACDESIKQRDLLKLQVVGAIGEKMSALTKTVKNL